MASVLLFLAMAMAAVVIVFVQQAAAGKSEMHMVFYMHDNLSGTNVTASPVAGFNASSSDPGKFGTVVVNCDVITKRPQITESHADNIMGRVQGIWIDTNLVTGLDFFMAFTVIFEDKDYNGSTLEFHGTDRFDQPHRELAVVGGTGKFRFARGYTIFTTEVLSGPNSVIKFNTTLRTH